MKMASEDTGIQSQSIQDESLEKLLDAVDNRTHQQDLFHNLISDGFMSLARERYRDPSSTERMYYLWFDTVAYSRLKLTTRFILR